VLCGSAFKNKGVQRLLYAVNDYLPSPLDTKSIVGHDPEDLDKMLERKADDNEPFSALAFKVQSDPHMGKLIYFRVYSGSIKAGTYIFNSTKGKTQRVGRILQMHANNREIREDIFTGDIAAAIGFDSTTTGDTLCDEKHPIILEAIEFPAPVMSLSIKPKSQIDQDKLTKGLIRLAEEDPTFTVKTDEETDEVILSGMGELHLEIIVDRLKHEFGVEAEVGAPKVAYRETILRQTKESYKHSKQTGGRGQYAHVELIIEPAEAGKGFEFVDKIKGGSVPKEYIPAVEKGIIDIMQRGIYAGYPVVDVKVTLVDGSYHEVDSSEIAFKLAGAGCFKAAFLKSSPVLLEPQMSLEITCPEEYMGSIVGDACSRRGKVMGMDTKGNQQVVSAEAPLSEMFGYASALRTLSSGRANYSMHFEKYTKAPDSLAEKVLDEVKKAKDESR